jgi:hypothetical protein
MEKQNQPPTKSGQQPSKGGTQTGQQQMKPGQNQPGSQTAPSHDDKSQTRSGNK